MKKHFNYLAWSILFFVQDDTSTQNLDLGLIDGDEVLRDSGILTSGTFGGNTPRLSNDGSAASSSSEAKRMAITKYCKGKDDCEIMKLSSP